MTEPAVAVAVPAAKLCAVVPTFDNPRTVGAVVHGLRRHGLEVVVVDDGSDAEGRAAVAALAQDPLVHAHHRGHNGGKGAAVKTALELAQELGFTHALQVDADGQHELADVPRFVEAANENPGALVLGSPRFDRTAPRSRLVGRQITRFWTNLETGGSVIDDPMCGFRVYPIGPTLAAGASANRMDFDIEIAVKLVWAGLPVINLPTAVRYLPAELGGVSHFDLLRDNARISWTHTKLMNQRMFGLLTGWIRGR